MERNVKGGGAMKSSRQTAILSLVEQQDIRTQEELAEKLRERGISVTQATVSRDIKELRLLKVMSEGGGYKYATADRAEHGISERFVRMFVDSVISINYSGNIVVIRTLAGSANVAGEAIDNMRWSEILGTLSGDNTIFVVTRTPEDAPNVVERFREIIR
jgi:transcriptional regulator of arginine metabolism